MNLVGYATSGLGLGETLRRFAAALDAASLPYSVLDVQVNLGERGRDLTLVGRLRDDAPYPINLIFVNADQMADVQASLGQDRFEGRLNIGYWFWELEGFPTIWHEATGRVDHVWTATRFVQQALQPAARTPVRCVPHPVVVPAISGQEAAVAGERWGLESDRYWFFSSFDFHSFISRKNPLGVVRAFKEAFPNDGALRAGLVLKSINGARAPEALASLCAAVGADARVRCIDEFLDPQEHVALMQRCNAFISLHRSEGFGQGMAEAMAMGKPVVGTAYSGNLDFMTPDNSWLVPASRVALGPEDYPHGLGQYWAEPDLSYAARVMRELARDPRAAAAVGMRAQQDIARTNGVQACLEGLLQGLTAVGALK